MTRLTEQDGRTALRTHVEQKASEARLRNGLYIDAEQIIRMLDDRAVVRYPVGIRFEAEPLEPGEFAWPMPLGDHPAAGFCLFIHPWFESQPQVWPLLIAYHIPTINYGDIASHQDAELYGATLLGMSPDEYYQAICELVDSLPAASA
ncbi:MAG: hypothetical protein KDA21_02005 [Phycisphaerales bacterium]|nr:hypothetical protein [Phycisphaerales bacterium]